MVSSLRVPGSIINRGDSFRRRRSRSNSVQPPTELALSMAAGMPSAASPQQPRPSPSTEFPIPTPTDEDDSAEYERLGSYRVPIIGAAGVGKTALIHQFRTSECINAYDCPASGDGDEREAQVSIVLNSYESEIVFVNVSSMEEFQEETCQDVAGWVVVYSITDKASFQKAGELLEKLKSMLLLRNKAIAVVGNKCELVRSRAVNVDGKFNFNI
ncbi:Small GTPase superfamily [Trinorchestia longiramus]|nr:Small GTPase superfamily [Trinorchestia longiramus]